MVASSTSRQGPPLYNYKGSGMSVMETSHRGSEFMSIINKAQSDLRALLAIPEDTHDVLFLQGATTQFAAIPLNLCFSTAEPVDYIVTGSWGDKAFKEAKKYASPKVVWSGKEEKYIKIPAFGNLELTPGAKYLHICAQSRSMLLLGEEEDAALSSSSSFHLRLRAYFIGMGYSPSLVDSVIAHHKGQQEDVELILDALLHFSSAADLDNSSSDSLASLCDDQDTTTRGGLHNSTSVQPKEEQDVLQQ